MRLTTFLFAFGSTVLTIFMAITMIGDPTIAAHPAEPITPGLVIGVLGYMGLASAIGIRAAIKDASDSEVRS